MAFSIQDFQGYLVNQSYWPSEIWQLGNPDILNLATLKIEIKIHYLLINLKQNLKSDLILSCTLNFLSKNLTEIWQP